MAIDPGPVQSAWLLLDNGRISHPGNMGIWPNEDLRAQLRPWASLRDVLVIEQIASYGMAVGAEIFATVHWAGRFHEAAHPGLVVLLPRLAVKTHLCHDSRAKDANIRAALIDRFGGPTAIRKGGALYGVHADLWSALALAVTYADMAAS